MLFRICPYCGAHLDPGEVCECEKVPDDPEAERENEQKADQRQLWIEQLRIDLNTAQAEQARITQDAKRIDLENARADLLRMIRATAKTA